MMEYDGDNHKPAQFLVNPPSIDRTMGEYLIKSGVHLMAISETQKYDHIRLNYPNGDTVGHTGVFNAVCGLT